MRNSVQAKFFTVTEIEKKSTRSRPTYPESEFPSKGRLRLHTPVTEVSDKLGLRLQGLRLALKLWLGLRFGVRVRDTVAVAYGTRSTDKRKR